MIWVDALLPGLLFGLASSAHCAGMCGVFALQAAAAPTAGAAPLKGGLAAPLRMASYLIGKSFSYVFLGALAGAAGAGVMETFAGAQPVLGAAVGAILVVAGWRMLRPARPSRLGLALGSLLAPLYRTTYRVRESGGTFALGALTALIPCGVVYLAVLQAGTLGSPLRGGALMLAFGVGTGPVLLVVGLVGRTAMARLGPARLRTAGGALVVLAGAVGIVRALLPLITGGEPCCH